MNSFFVSAAVVAVAEIGDKTQLLALVLASKFRKPLPIILGILVATLANHAGAAAVGTWFSRVIGPDVMRWLLGMSFIAMGIWTLVPDKAGRDDEKQSPKDGWGVFGTTTMAFFLLEMGDKTQIATVALAAKYSNLALVTAGTTFGMMLANVPAVLLGDVAAKKLPLALVRAVAALMFVVLGVVALFGVVPGFAGTQSPDHYIVAGSCVAIGKVSAGGSPRDKQGKRYDTKSHRHRPYRMARCRLHMNH